MGLTLNCNTFHELTYDEMLMVDGGVSLEQALSMCAIAIGIVQVAWTPAQVLRAKGPAAMIMAATAGLAAMISLVSSLY